MDSEAVLQAIERNPVSCNWRVSGELVASHFQNIAKYLIHPGNNIITIVFEMWDPVKKKKN